MRERHDGIANEDSPGCRKLHDSLVVHSKERRHREAYSSGRPRHVFMWFVVGSIQIGPRPGPKVTGVRNGSGQTYVLKERFRKSVLIFDAGKKLFSTVSNRYVNQEVVGSREGTIE